MNRPLYKFGMQKPRRSEQGMVLIITLLVLVAMLLVSTALMRSTNVAVQVVSNLSFRQAAESTSNIAVERAVQAIVANNASGNPLPSCFYSSRQSGESAEGIPAVLLNGSAAPVVCVEGVAGMTVAYIVEAMCAAGAGGVTPANCLLSGLPGGVERHIDGERRLGDGGGGGAAVPVYRVSMRVDGVKNTTVFAQAFID